MRQILEDARPEEIHGPWRRVAATDDLHRLRTSHLCWGNDAVRYVHPKTASDKGVLCPSHAIRPVVVQRAHDPAQVPSHARHLAIEVDDRIIMRNGEFTI